MVFYSVGDDRRCFTTTTDNAIFDRCTCFVFEKFAQISSDAVTKRRVWAQSQTMGRVKDAISTNQTSLVCVNSDLFFPVYLGCEPQDQSADYVGELGSNISVLYLAR